MHLPLVSLLVILLALALASSQDPDFSLPPAFAHLLPSIPGTEADIGQAVQAAMTVQPRILYSERWLVLGWRAPRAGEEWGFVAVNLQVVGQPYFDPNQLVRVVAPPSYGKKEHYIEELSDVVRETQYHLVPLKILTDIGIFRIAPVEAALAYETNSPRDVWYWYDQFFRAIGVDISKGSGAE